MGAARPLTSTVSRGDGSAVPRIGREHVPGVKRTQRSSGPLRPLTALVIRSSGNGNGRSPATASTPRTATCSMTARGKRLPGSGLKRLQHMEGDAPARAVTSATPSFSLSTTSTVAGMPNARPLAGAARTFTGGSSGTAGRPVSRRCAARATWPKQTGISAPWLAASTDPGWDPYLITVERAESDRRTSFRGVLDDDGTGRPRTGRL